MITHLYTIRKAFTRGGVNFKRNSRTIWKRNKKNKKKGRSESAFVQMMAGVPSFGNRIFRPNDKKQKINGCE